ncbi:MAG: N-acetyltransferase [Planctomycetota bacterium]
MRPPQPPAWVESQHTHGSARCTAYTDAARRQWRVGHYDSPHPPDGVALLRKVVRYAEQNTPGPNGNGHPQTAPRIVGPMEASTWRPYRFVVDWNTAQEERERPAFLFEPTHPRRYVEEWREAGFTPVATYLSSWCPDTAVRDPRMQRVNQRLHRTGVCTRPMALDRFEAELSAVHALSLEAFAQNPFYTPISRQAFIDLYTPVRHQIAPELVLLAEHQDGLAGYVFATPDAAQAARGEAIDTLIVKTVAVRPGRAYAGLGQWLVEQVQLAGHAMGLRHAVHALMHESNASTRLSEHYAKPFRRYALFGRPLGAEDNAGAGR